MDLRVGKHRLPHGGLLVGLWREGVGEMVATGADGGPYMLPRSLLPCGAPPFVVSGEPDPRAPGETRTEAGRGVRLREPVSFRFAGLLRACAQSLKDGDPALFHKPVEVIPL